MDMHEEQERFIEFLGQMTEAEGVPRIAARIFALLLLAAEELSLDEIAEQLSVSRASVSTDARRMEGCGFLERVTRRGDRRDYYRVSPDHIVHAMERKAATMERFASAFAMGSELSGLTPVAHERVEKCARAYRMLADKMWEDVEIFKKVFPPTTVAPVTQLPPEALLHRFRANTSKETSQSEISDVSKTKKRSSRDGVRSKK